MGLVKYYTCDFCGKEVEENLFDKKPIGEINLSPGAYENLNKENKYDGVGHFDACTSCRTKMFKYLVSMIHRLKE